MIDKKWIIKEQPEDDVNALMKLANLSCIAAKVLYSRGIKDKNEIQNFLRSDIKNLNNPFLLSGIDKAVNRINKAIESGEKITVYGDYDVDGITSVSLLCLYFKTRGAECAYYIPERSEEGYGINVQALEKIKNDGTTLLITVDCGITAVSEMEYAKNIGLDVIITDHHECKETMPVCEAIVNPKLPCSKYPFKELAGVGVAFKLICALSGEENTENLFNTYSDIVAVGTIADVMPLLNENRSIVSHGLKKLSTDTLCGLKELLFQTGIDGRKKLTSSAVSFILAPRINAAGRIGRASLAVELFLTEDPVRASAIAQELCLDNKLRHDTENEIMEKAQELINGNDEKDKVIVLCDENWHHGIIGIVASRLSDKYHCPIILISTDGQTGKGSGRSVKGFNLFEALENCSELLLKYGGHELAAGLTINCENIKDFIKKINAYANSNLSEEALIPSIEADCEIDIDKLSIKDVKTLDRLEPFGMGNPVPVFFIKGVKLSDVSGISMNKHTKLTLKKDSAQIAALYFGKKFKEFDYIAGDSIDIMCNLDINNFRDNETVQLIVRDVRLSTLSAQEHFDTIKKFDRFFAGDFSVFNEEIPSLEDFKILYSYLKSQLKKGNNRFSRRLLYKKISEAFNVSLSYFETEVCLAVFEELELLAIAKDDFNYVIKLNENIGKVELTSSPIYTRIKNGAKCG